MWKWLFNLLALLSTLAFLAIAILWVANPNDVKFASWCDDDDVVYWIGIHDRMFQLEQIGIEVPTTWPLSPESGWTLLGIHYRHETEIPPMSGKFGPAHVVKVSRIAISYWFVAAICGILPVLAIVRKWRRKLADNVCGSCGYDLRGSPSDCPECGGKRPIQLVKLCP
ncbi:MAG: hypothetical protein WD768_23560 [Phycisphaeraceae bacterium]